ncbi:uncharacterized protein [Salvelinus alpinus]|uniref:uncharacterized protein n=1 Tax=Salvelinus alpinus TaxID=8036 RepID=UPI0039FC5206
MKAAWSVEESYPHITPIGCAAHALNLLLKDIMTLKTMDTIYKRAKEMVRYVKCHQVIAANFVTKQSEKNKSTTLKLPSKPRWGGVVMMFDSLLEGESLQEMAISQSADMDSPIKRILLDDVFWERVVSSLKLLKPIAVDIARIEGGNATLSDVQTLLADVREEVRTALPTSLLLQAGKTAVLKYIKKHTSAYFLDPKYAGKSILSGAEINKAYGVITTVSRHLGLDEGKVLGSLAKDTSKKSFGMEMQYGSHANISQQPPGGRDFVDLRLFPLLPLSSSSKSHQHQPPQSATGPCLGTHTPKHATG